MNPSDSSDVITFGNGSRGDLQAISASILLNSDSLSATLDADPTAGGVKEPLHKLMQVMRSLEFRRSLTHRRLDGLISAYTQQAFGQSPYGTPDQFSFFSPEYMPPGAHLEASLVSPESELLNMNYIIGGQNALYSLIQEGLVSCNGGIGPVSRRGIVSGCGLHSAGVLGFTVSDNLFSGANVVSRLSTLLTADRLSRTSQELIESAYFNAFSFSGKSNAMQVAQALIVSTPEFHTTNKALPLDERESSPSSLNGTSQSYKAIIHLNLFGGMDSMNLLVPHPQECQSLYDEYKAMRGENLCELP